MSDLDPTRVDVDPSLFGEFPDDPDVERISDDYEGIVSAEEHHRWKRQTTLVGMIGSCVRCDGPIDEKRLRGPDDATAVKYKCQDCKETWVSNSESRWNYSGL